jgi:hypothetical protein
LNIYFGLLADAYLGKITCKDKIFFKKQLSGPNIDTTTHRHQKKMPAGWDTAGIFVSAVLEQTVLLLAGNCLAQLVIQ